MSGLVAVAFSAPASAAGLTNVSAVVAGDYHSCAITSTTRVECWGQNTNGELGNGTTTDSGSPVAVLDGAGTAPLSGVTQLDTGANTCALMSGGTVECWGANNDGQLGIGTTSGPDTCGGQACSPLPVEVEDPAGTGPLTNVTQIAGGGLDECALLADTSAVCWGDDHDLQIGDVNAPLTVSLPDVVKLDPSQDPLTGIRGLSESGAHTCAAMLDGTARCWGYNFWGELGNNTTTEMAAPTVVKDTTGTTSLTGVAAISAGGSDTCALLSNQTVDCWGAGSDGEIGNGTTTFQQKLPTPVPNGTSNAYLSGVTGIGVGGTGACALLTDGTVRCWGDNSWLQLGNGALLGPDACGASSVCSTRPVTVEDSGGDAALSGVDAISIAGASSCALMADATAQCWGYNSTMQLGDGTTVGRCLPVTVGVTGPSAEAPAAPTGVSATRGVDEATVSWALQTGDCGTPVTTFTVTASPGGQTQDVSAWLGHGFGTLAQWQTSLDFDVTPGVHYTFTVTATDGAGTSSPSAPSNSVVALGGPSAPSAVTAHAGDHAATVHWTAPTLTNGRPITGYEVTTWEGATSLGPQTFDSPATTETVTHIPDGQSLTFTVAAINGYGTGLSSAPSNAVTPAGVPTAPRDLTVAPLPTTAGAGSLTVAYVASTGNGSAITRFTARCVSSDGGVAGSAVHAGATAVPITVSGLSTKRVYTCTVTSTNGVGTSAASAHSAAVIVGSPAAPTSVVAVNVATGRLRVSFSAPADDGRPITGYMASCTSTNGGVTRSATGTHSPMAVAGLSAGKSYACRVTATNVRGAGPPSAPSAAVTA